MPVFELQASDGSSYEVDGPDPTTAIAAFKKMQAAQPSTTEDVVKSAGTGVAKGAIGAASMGGDYRNLIMDAGQWLGGKVVGPEKAAEARQAIQPKVDAVAQFLPPMLGGGRTSAQNTQAIEGAVGGFHEPQTTAGHYAKTIGEFLPAAIGGPGGLARRAFTQAVVPGALSEAAGQATEGKPYEPYARVGAAIASPLATGGLARLITPAPSSAIRQQLVQNLNDEGVTALTAGQRTGNKTLQYAESILGDAPGAGQQTSHIQQEGQQQFTRAAMRRAGDNLPDATPEVLADNNRRLGQNFTNLSARNNVTFDQPFVADMQQAIRDYHNVPPSQQRAIVENYVNDIVGHMQNGQMPGVQYQEMRSRLSRQSNGLRNSDPTLSDALRNIRDALDANMSRSISPADREAWQTTRRQYGAQKDIEKSVSRAGVAGTEGQITPANLRNTAAANNRGAYARGEGQFSELARAGAGVMAPLPNSGTGQRLAVHSVAMGLGSALGGGAGAIFGNAPGAVAGGTAGAAAGAAMPALLGRLLMSRAGQGYAGNQVMNLAPPGERERMLALLLRGGAALPSAKPAPQIENRR